jgi:hypothetical protein
MLWGNNQQHAERLPDVQVIGVPLPTRNRCFLPTFSQMGKKIVRVEIVEKGEEHFLLKVFFDGSGKAFKEEAFQSESGLESEAEHRFEARVLR